VDKEEVQISSGMNDLKNFATATLIASAVLKLVMNGALSQVWGMINGLQLFTHMPLFRVTIPPLAMKLVTTIINIATFDIPYINIKDIFGESALPEIDEVFKQVDGRETLIDHLG